MFQSGLNFIVLGLGLLLFWALLALFVLRDWALALFGFYRHGCKINVVAFSHSRLFDLINRLRRASSFKARFQEIVSLFIFWPGFAVSYLFYKILPKKIMEPDIFNALWPL